MVVLDDPKLSKAAKTLIEDGANDILVSPASYWEIAIKVGLGKLDLRSSCDDFMERGIAGNDFVILPMDPKHTSLLTTLPTHHKDPFDRLLAAAGCDGEHGRRQRRRGARCVWRAEAVVTPWANKSAGNLALCLPQPALACVEGVAEKGTGWPRAVARPRPPDCFPPAAVGCLLGVARALREWSQTNDANH